MPPLLDVKDLEIEFHSHEEVLRAVEGISFTVEPGETLAIVGESGSGKSVTSLALTRLLPAPPTCRVGGQIRFQGRDLLQMKVEELRRIRGHEIAYIFQEPASALNPVFTVGAQIAEVVRLHRPEVRDVRGEVIRALEAVHIRRPELRYRDYPHQMSGGMQQRVMIAMALAGGPKLLVADEPTTALDVTIQAQIMDLLRELRVRTGMAVVLITHNFGIVSGFADRVLVLFRGRIVEEGPTEQILRNPRHPYTQALISCIPQLGQRRRRLATIDHGQLDRAPSFSVQSEAVRPPST